MSREDSGDMVDQYSRREEDSVSPGGEDNSDMHGYGSFGDGATRGSYGYGRRSLY